MESKFEEKPSGDASSPQSESVANELRALSLQPAPSLLPIRERRGVLRLKLLQRRTSKELINRGVMPPLKSSGAFYEQRRTLERTRTENYLKRKMRSRPQRSELVRMHILEETTAEPSLQAKQLQLKKARLADDLNDKISHRPGTMELVHKNILPVHCSVKEAIALSAPSLTLTNGTSAPSVPRMGVTSQITSQPKPSTDQRHRKLNNKPKIRKLKYHQYIHPDQKVDKEPSPCLDSLGKRLQQQQQLFLQLQMPGHQPQQFNCHTTLPAPPSSLQKNPQPSSSSKSAGTSSSPRLPAAPSASPSAPASRSGQRSAALGRASPVSLPPNLDELTVVELKFLLKLRSLPVSGTKTNLIERLRTYQELSGGSDTTPSPTAGGTTGLGAEVAGSSQTAAATTTDNNNNTSHSGSISTSPTANPQEVMTCSSRVSSSSPSFTLSEHLPATSSPDDASYHNDPAGETLKSPPTRLPGNIKQELHCSTPSPCQFSLKPTSPRKHSSAALTTTTTAPALTPDKDKMLREKDKKIKELTRMLGQKQRLVELLMKQLEHGKGGAHVSEPVVLVRLKEEAPDEPKEVLHETTSQSVDSGGLPQRYSQTQETQKNQGIHDCPQQNTLQLAQQQAAQKLLLQRDMWNSNQVLEKGQRLQELSEQGKKKCHKQQQLLQHQQSKQQQQQVHQIPMEEQKPPSQRQINQPQRLQMQTKQQQVRVQQKQQVQQQQTASAPTFPRPLKRYSAPALVIDSNSRHFLMTLGSHVTENHRTDAPDGTAANHNTAQDKEQEDGFIDVVLQRGETSTSFKPAADSSLDCLRQDSSASPASPFTPQLLLSAPQPPPPVQPELQSLVSATEDKQQLSNIGGGRLEDFLESTTGKPLLGVEPGGLLTLIDDLHSQMLCTPSILDNPPSPMDTLDIAAVLDSADWLDLSMGGEMGDESPALAPMGPQTPPSVFCTDFLDSTDLQTGMDWPLGIPGIFPVGRRAILADCLDTLF